MKKSLYIVLIMAWVILWVTFTMRELVVKKNMSDYAALFSMPLECKHAYVTGEKLYEFINFSNARLPENVSYRLIGIEDGSIDQRRAVYYLYPHMQKDDADFLLVFNGSHYAEKHYRRFAELDSERCILIKETVF